MTGILRGLAAIPLIFSSLAVQGATPYAWNPEPTEQMRSDLARLQSTSIMRPLVELLRDAKEAELRSSMNVFLKSLPADGVNETLRQRLLAAGFGSRNVFAAVNEIAGVPSLSHNVCVRHRTNPSRKEAVLLTVPLSPENIENATALISLAHGFSRLSVPGSRNFWFCLSFPDNNGRFDGAYRELESTASKINWQFPDIIELSGKSPTPQLHHAGEIRFRINTNDRINISKLLDSRSFTETVLEEVRNRLTTSIVWQDKGKIPFWHLAFSPVRCSGRVGRSCMVDAILTGRDMNTLDTIAARVREMVERHVPGTSFQDEQTRSRAAEQTEISVEIVDRKMSLPAGSGDMRLAQLWQSTIERPLAGDFLTGAFRQTPARAFREAGRNVITLTTLGDSPEEAHERVSRIAKMSLLLGTKP